MTIAIQDLWLTKLTGACVEDVGKISSIIFLWRDGGVPSPELVITGRESLQKQSLPTPII
jgi:hypothetical protein